jgi:hypothetical protein
VLTCEPTEMQVLLLFILYQSAQQTVSKSKVKQSRNSPWRPVGLWDVKDPTLSRESAHS